MLSNDRLHITNNADIPDSYICTQMTLPAGTYRFGAEVSDTQGTFASNLLRVVALGPTQELEPARWDGVAGRITTPRFDLAEARTVELRVMVGPHINSAVWVRHLFVMTETDYQLMDIANFRWFNGSLIEVK